METEIQYEQNKEGKPEDSNITDTADNKADNKVDSNANTDNDANAGNNTNTDKNINYDGSSIVVLEGLSAVRKRPAMYIGNTGIAGLHHMVYEIVDNSIDEALAGFCNKIEVTVHKDNSITVLDNGRGIPADIMPKYNKSALEVVMTVLHAGGKFENSAYKVSGGLHGVGASVVNALSEIFEVDVHRNGKIYYQKYEKGIPVCEVKIIGEANNTGTKIHFMPDIEIFKEINFNFATIISRLRELAFLNKGLKIIATDERIETNNVKEFCYGGGIKEFVTYLNENKKVLHNVIYIEKFKDEVVVELALQYNDGYSENILSFANNIHTIDGGFHEVGFKAALNKVINKYVKENKVLKEGENLEGEDIREGLTAVISVKLKNPEFEGQTKTRLGNNNIRGIVDGVVSEYLGDYFEKHPNDAKNILTKAANAMKARDAARKAREIVRRKGIFDKSSLPGKLADCASNDAEKCEIYIVEGDSAGGCFSGDTKVALLDGRNLCFKELVKEYGEGKRNYCYTIKKDGSIGTGLIENPRITKKNAIVIKIILDNDEEIICTPDHQFMLRDGSYCMAKNLTNIDSIMPNAMIEAVKNYNCKIKKIVEIDQKTDVYDLEVKGTHNFALSSGIFVHNSAKLARNKEFQAILPLKGKILNVEKARLDKILENNEIVAMITAIGTGISEDFNIAKLRYHKIICMTDADVDGSHIRTLMLTFFFRYMKQLVEQGHVFIALPPLYRIKKGKTEQYFYNDDELKKFLEENGNEGITLQRYKGLGEMNPEQLWNTTMDMDNRTIVKVTIGDAVEADRIFTLLMGEEVEPRRDFIQKHALEVVNLDI